METINKASCVHAHINEDKTRKFQFRPKSLLIINSDLFVEWTGYINERLREVLGILLG